MKASQVATITTLALLAGGAGGFFLGQSRNLPASADVVFAQDMMTHHAQAIDMANRLNVRLLAEPKLNEQQQIIKYLTYDIITGQSNQNGQMLGWLNLWNQSATNPEPMDMEAMGMATAEQVQNLSTLPLNDATISFLQLMIRHHQGGVMMAEDALKAARTEVVKNLAQKVVTAQSNEIREMKNLIAQFDAQPLEDLQPMPDMDHNH